MFSNIIPRAKHVLNTFKLKRLYARLYLFVVYILFAPVILTNIPRCVNNSLITKSWWRILKTKRLTLTLHQQNSPIWLILRVCVCTYVYINIYIRVCVCLCVRVYVCVCVRERERGNRMNQTEYSNQPHIWLS